VINSPGLTKKINEVSKRKGGFMKKEMLVLLIALFGLSGCGIKKKGTKPVKVSTQTEIDIPLADDSIRSFFDDEVGEFTLMEEETPDLETAADIGYGDEFAWADEEAFEGAKVVYFDFDRYSVRKDQEEALVHDLSYVQAELKKAAKEGIEPTVVVEGHACHSAGSAVYNLALSEKRAKVVANRFASEGLAVKTVGRGAEVPAVIGGKKVTGDRVAQAKNRRVEVKLVYS